MADRRVVRDLVRWFRASARELPWRREDPKTGRRDPYRSLISEVMLQQTQVSRVLDKFGPFIERFPDAPALAAADEAEVLAEWSGMGYYRRARLLHAAAREVVRLHGGEVPADAGLLLALPGVGRYTAGAVVSICFGQAAPIVDGNVKRVLMRLSARRGAQTGPAVDRWAWDRAEQLVQLAASRRPPAPGEFNEGLMELGATVCTPRAPKCGECPVRSQCAACATGVQENIPPPKPRTARRDLFCAAVILRDRSGRMLVERRADKGMWAGMWQAPTLEAEREPSAAEVAAILAGRDPGRVVARFEHGTTHRNVRFIVRKAAILGPKAAAALTDHRRDRRWLRPEQIAELALSNPQRRVLLEIGSKGRSTDAPGGVP